MDQDEKEGQTISACFMGRTHGHISWRHTIFEAFSTVIRSEDDGVSPDKILPALQTVVDSYVKICRPSTGHGICGRLDVTEEEYLLMIYKKTAALIAAPPKLEPYWVGEHQNRLRPWQSMVAYWNGLPDSG